MVTVAVDAGGADLGPAEVAAGAAVAAAQGTGVLLFGPAAEIGEVPDGVEVIDAPISIAKAAYDPSGHYSRGDVVRLMVNRNPRHATVKFSEGPKEGGAEAKAIDLA